MANGDFFVQHTIHVPSGVFLPKERIERLLSSPDRRQRKRGRRLYMRRAKFILPPTNSVLDSLVYLDARGISMER